MTFRRYVISKALWFGGAFVVALIFNFLLPRLIPGNPVDTLVAQMASGGSISGEQLNRIYDAYIQQFGLDKPMYMQFIAYVGALLQGDMGVSFARSPARVQQLIGQALPWTLALQVPTIIIGWLIGNRLGVITAYKRGWIDRIIFPVALFVSSVPFYCLSIIFLYLLTVYLPIFPSGGGYAFSLTPGWTWAFASSVAKHYVLPFLSLTLVFIGGQAIGMRAMSIYELDADYVRYSRSMGVSDKRIMDYIFHNAMLPQITGLALSIGTMVSGALITEIVFNYPGIGTLLFSSIRRNDYPVVQGVTLLIMVGVLIANFAVDIAYGFIDPRVRASATGER